MIVKKNYAKLILVSLMLISSAVYSQMQPACPNANFSQGGFNNWQAYTGVLITTSDTTVTPIIEAVWDPFQVNGVVSGRHTIISTPGFDPYSCGGLPLLPPGSFVVAKLGDSNTGCLAEALRYTMPITIDNALLIYKYAAVLENGGASHNEYSQPKMKINIRDAAGNPIPGACGAYDVYSGQSGQNFQTCNDVNWLPWSTAALDLSAYIGQTIQVEFITQDCDKGSHFGYAYFTMSCQPLKLTVQYCQGSNNAVLTAPTGFSSYLWSNGATTPSITIPNPITGTTYSCTLTTLTNAGSCSVTIDAEVEPTIVLPDYTYTQNCGQLNVQFTNTSTVNNNVIIANLWNFGDNTTSNQSSPNHTFAAPGVYNVRLVSYETAGCRDTMIKQVTVKSIPTADFTVPSTCVFAPVTASNTSTDLINQTMTYSWDFGDGTPLQTAANPSHVYQTAGTFTITLIAMNEDSCTHTRVRNIIVNSLPPVEAGVDQQLCPYTPMTLNGSGAVSYTWNNGATNGTPFIPSVDGKYIVTGTDANGCINKDSLMVTFLPAPVVSAGADVTVCENTSVTFTGTGAATTYTWDNGITDGQAYVPAVGTYTIVLHGYDASNCFGLDTVILTVNPLPIVNAGPDQIICTGSAATLAGSGANSYVWDNGITDNVPFSPTSTLTYTVTGTSAVGCVNTDQVIVSIETPITIQIATTSEPACEPHTAMLINNSTGTPSANTQWVFGDGNTLSSLNDTVTNLYENQGCYDLTVTSTTALGCVWSQSYPSFICVYPNPVANFTANPGVISVISPESNLVNSSSGAVQYIWDFGDGTEISNDFSPTHTFVVDPEQNFQVTLVAITEHGCVDSITKIILMEKGVILYAPNSFTPDGNQFNPVFLPIVTSGVDKNEYKLEVFNRWGELVFETTDTLKGWDGTYKGIACKEGMYSWKITYKLSSSDEKREQLGHVNIFR
jgi:gliding motility-associated-like protein